MLKAGQVLSYHNHAHEFYASQFQGKPNSLLEYHITRKSNPRFLQAELDTYWVQAGGGDPVAWCKKMKGRMPLLHIKDYSVGPDGKPFFAEIGNGNLDWPAIFSAAEASGTEWFIVEQDVCPGDPFESLAMSFRFINENLVSK